MINYNVDPYYDDFDPTKNYHRILFKPGHAVQARELTQSQTILQNQISQFASAIYSQNTPVSGGKVTTNLNCNYIKLNTTYSGSSITAVSFLNQIITDSTGQISAKVIATAEATGNSVTPGDPPTLIVTYISGQQFTDAMTIYVQGAVASTPSATTIGSTGGTTSVGSSSVASISAGVFYVVSGYNQITTNGNTSNYTIGNFVNVLPQTVILDKYDSVPSLRIGLNIVESTISYNSDTTLLDPAVGASNYQAPGADRYEITLSLETRPLTLGNDDGFIELVKLSEGEPIKQVIGTSYSAIDDYFAKRDYEANGDYIVKDFRLTPAANGVLNTNNTGTVIDPTKYDLGVGKGIAYVRGYRIENQSQLLLTSDRARQTTTVGTNSVLVDYGNFFIVDTLNGVFDISTQPSVDLHCVGAGSISLTSSNNYNSTLIGTARIRNLKYVSSNGSNTQSYIFNAYVCDTNYNTLTSAVTSASATTITVIDNNNLLSNTANAYYGVTLKVISGSDSGDIRTVSNYSATGNSKTFTVSSAFTLVPSASDNFSLLFGVNNVNSLAQQSGYTSLTANANISIVGGGKNGILPTSPTVLQNSGSPEMIFPIGYPYVANVSSSNYYSTMLFRNQRWNNTSNTLTISVSQPGVTFNAPIGTNISGYPFKQLFTLFDTSTGKILDFSNSGNTAFLSSNSQVVFTSSTYGPSANNIDVMASMFISNGEGSSAVLKYKTLVTGNTTLGSVSSTFVNVTSNTSVSTVSGTASSQPLGQTYILNSAIGNTAVSLYVSDVKRIAKIVDTGSTGANTFGQLLSSFTDITGSFAFDNGQRDNSYEHAKITLLPGVSRPKGNILVVYDLYSHTGGDGYFNIQSYTNESYPKIPYYTAKDGTTYALRDCMDFRPSKQNCVTTGAWEYNNNPTSSPYNGGVLLPTDFSNIQDSYSYYLGRKDLLVLTKDSQFKVIEGSPSLNPIFPQEPNGSLLLAKISLDPYTAYVPGENPDGVPANLSINKILHKRWAKSDITDLQTQVDNLEYYTALSQLEAQAAQTQVTNNYGVTRPNYGILVDDFSSFGTADTTNPNYASTINIRKKQLGPLTTVNNFQLQNPQVLNSLGTANTFYSYSVNNIAGTQTNIYTLPYTTANIISQPLASNTISVNPFSVVVEQGFLSMNPPMDNWVNTIEVPSILINDPTLQVQQQAGGINLTNLGDFASWPGTEAVVGSTATSTSAITGTNSTSNPTNSFTAIPTATYAAQTTGLQNAQLSSASSVALSSVNGYVTNTSALANIRPQEIIIRAKNLLVNTPIHCYFDGTKVDQWMTAPNTIELTGVTGKFNQDDIVGFFEPSVSEFFPIARVVSVYNYPNTTKTRLYVATMVGLPSSVSTNSTFQNAFFDVNGNYQGRSASGTVTLNSSGSIFDLHTSGLVSQVGGGFTPANSPSSAASGIYKSVPVSGWSSFLNNYGVWGDNHDGGSWIKETTSPSALSPFYFTPTTTGTYTVTIAGGDVYNATVYLTQGTSSSSFFTVASGATLSTYPSSYTTTLTAGTTYYVNFALYNSGGGAYTSPSFAMTVQDPSGNVVWNSSTPPNLTLSNGTTYACPGGGAFYVGVNTIQLDGNALKANSVYVGSQISVKSTYTYNYNYGSIYYPPPPPYSGDGDCCQQAAYGAIVAQYNSAVNQSQINIQNQTITLSSTTTYTANIVAYNGVTQTATLDTPINVSMGYNSSYGSITSHYNIIGQAESVAGAISGGGVATLSTNENGEFVGIFNVPGSMFWIGERVFRVDNRVTSKDPTSATTWAEGTFYATGLHTTQQNQDFAASVDAAAISFSQTAQNGYNIVAQTPKIDPIAQTFLVDKAKYPNGVFLNSLKLYFAPFTSGLTPTVPVSVYLLNTTNGYPSGQALAHSTVTMDGVNVVTSDNPQADSSFTEFTFDAPVYIQPGVLYAFVVQSSSADYNLWYAQQNQIAVNLTSSTGVTKIGQTPYIGSLFESQNAITWSADQNKNLMFIFDQCVFDTTTSPNILFTVPANLPYRKLGRYDIMHGISANSVPNVYSIYGKNQVMDAFNVSTTDFTPTTSKINYAYQTTLLNGFNQTGSQPVSPGKYGTPTQDNVYLSDGQGERVLLQSSNSSFQLTATLSSTDPNVSPVISDDGVSLYSLIYHINNMGIDGNIISVANTGTGYNANTVAITVSAPDVGSDYATFGFTQNTVSGGINSIYTIYPGSGYHTTPTITITDAATRSGNANAIVTVQGETSPLGGNGYAKYFTKKVIMPAGNDAGDMRVYYTAYKPNTSDVLVYYKILSSHDNQTFENQNWQLMTQVTNLGVYSPDRTSLIEYEWAPGVNNVANNNISYTSTNGISYNNYIQFAIKVVMKTSDRTNVPFLTDIRAIALPSGTGL